MAEAALLQPSTIFDFLGGLAASAGVVPLQIAPSPETPETPQCVRRSNSDLAWPLPDEIIVVGWPSGDSLQDIPAALDQKWIAAREALQPLLPSAGSSLAELTPEVLKPVLPSLPESLRLAARFPGEETRRIEKMLALLQNQAQHGREPLLSQLGELLFESAFALQALGLHSPRTEAMVEALHEIGVSLGFYGARAEANGAVLIVMEKAGLSHLQEVRDALRKTIDPHLPLLF